MKKPKLLKRVFAVLSLAPLVNLGARVATHRLSANPIADVLNVLGFWALVLLLASLAATPLQIVFGWNWPIKVRKLLGLAAFFYASLHVAVYVGLDQFFSWRDIAADVVKRTFITVGVAAFVVLLPLAWTSRKRVVARMGFARWKRLHRAAYLAAALGVVHFLWRVKADHRQPLIFTGVFVILMAIRVFAWSRRRSDTKPASAAA